MKKKRNKIKCLECGEILESKHRHDFQKCSCLNEAYCDGGFDYQRIGAKDLDKVEFINEEVEVRELTDEELEQIMEANLVALGLNPKLNEDFKKYSKYKTPEKTWATNTTSTIEGIPQDNVEDNDLPEVAPNYEEMWNELFVYFDDLANLLKERSAESGLESEEYYKIAYEHVVNMMEDLEEKYK